VVAQEVELPIVTSAALDTENPNAIVDFVELPKGEHYALPFMVWGYYSVEGALSSPSMEHGVSLLRKVFEQLEINRYVEDRHLRHALKKVFVEEGLVVIKRH